MVKPSLILTDNASLHMEREVKRWGEEFHFAFVGPESFLPVQEGEEYFATGTLLEEPLVEAGTRGGLEKSVQRVSLSDPDTVLFLGEQLFGSADAVREQAGEFIVRLMETGHSVVLVYPGVAFKEIIRRSRTVRTWVSGELTPSIVFFG